MRGEEEEDGCCSGELGEGLGVRKGRVEREVVVVTAGLGRERKERERENQLELELDASSFGFVSLEVVGLVRENVPFTNQTPSSIYRYIHPERFHPTRHQLLSLTSSVEFRSERSEGRREGRIGEDGFSVGDCSEQAVERRE